MHEVLVNRLGGLSLPRKSVVRLTDRPDMTLDVYRGRKTTIQPIQPTLNTCKGVVRCPDLKRVRKQGVINVRRIKIRRDGTLKDTNTFVFTFNTSIFEFQLNPTFQIHCDVMRVKCLGIHRINVKGRDM